MNKEYYPIQKNWKKLRPIFESPRILQIMHSEMECFNEDRANVGGFEYKRLPFDLSLRPSRYDSCDWRFDRYREDGSYRRGPSPCYWEWACHSACHWVVNHNLEVISTLEPDRPWQISTSDAHSTVVDIERNLMFDTNFLAIGISAEKCWDMTRNARDSRLLKPGEWMSHDFCPPKKGQKDWPRPLELKAEEMAAWKQWLGHDYHSPLDDQRKFNLEKEKVALDRQLLLNYPSTTVS